MIDAGRKALDEGKIDSYSMKLGYPGYIVKVAHGKSSGEGRGASEDEAFSLALKDMSGGGSKDSKDK